jgi:2-C-methyl-D-erythritol 4-phosphate cytidylyltransferase
MQTDIPKQFLLLGGKPILLRTLEIFYDFDPSAQLLITLPSEWKDYWQSILDQYASTIPHQLIEGGLERFHSIQNALQHSTGKQIAVHDGVRPLVSIETISRCFAALENAEAVVPVLAAKDSIRKGSLDDSEAVDRKEYFLVHTPQCFHAAVIKSAYQQAFQNTFTDDASVVEAQGVQVKMVLSNEENIKITSQLDLKLTHALLTEN